MGQLDRPGTYRGSIQESSFGTTKNDYPQWVTRLLALEKYVEDKVEMEQFKITEPGWVPYDYGDSIVGYIVLAGEKGLTVSYEQIQKATGWDGSDFQDLAGNSPVLGKPILFKVENNEYNGKTSLKVSWIDKADADPNPKLREADPATIKAQTAKWLAGRAKPAVTKAATVAKPPVVAANPTPAAVSNPVAPAAEPPATAPVVAATPPAASSAPAAPKAPKAPKAKVYDTKEKAWAYVNSAEVKGQNDDGVITDAWLAVIGEISETNGGIGEEEFTANHWSNVAAKLKQDLAA
jgi:hypothetical protein